MPRCAKKKKNEDYWWATARPISFESIRQSYGRIRQESFLGRPFEAVDASIMTGETPVFRYNNVITWSDVSSWFESTPARDAEALSATLQERETTEE